jgi:secreted trypsin-like serine protease
MPPVKSLTKFPRPLRLGVASIALLGVLAATPAAIASKSPPAVAHQAIIGGAPAADGAFASLAYILDFRGGDGGQCTGTVVAPSLVLTAGHCAENMKNGSVNKPSGYRVVTGSVDWATGERQISKVLGAIVYPRFARTRDDGDAALLVLASPIATPPVTLANPSGAGLLVAGSRATMAGWGETSFEQKGLTERLVSANTVVQGSRWCKRNAPPFYAKDELCTISPSDYATGGCHGDSGGPLLEPGPMAGESIEIGIAIHVYGRCSTHRPTVYTRVDSISSWVHTWIEAYKRPSTSPAPLPTPAPTPVPAPAPAS